jgi:MOSC domain-containing protein YiiM
MHAAKVTAVHVNAAHAFSKVTAREIALVAGLGVVGDAHFGARVQHLSRVAVDPTQPNLRQVHLLHAELHDELFRDGHIVAPGNLGENITTRGLDLLSLPTATVLRLGADAIVALTGLRNPCQQIDRFQPGLLAKVASKRADGTVLRKAGVMGVVLVGGVVRPGDDIALVLPPGRPIPLERV